MQNHYQFSMLENHELTAQSLYTQIIEKFSDSNVSVQTVLHARKHLGWVSTTLWCVELNRD